MTENNEFTICRCGHDEKNHQWVKITAYDGPDAFSNPLIKEGWRGDTRKECKICTCQEFDPSSKHKAKWFAVGIGILVAFGIIYRLFIAG